MKLEETETPQTEVPQTATVIEADTEVSASALATVKDISLYRQYAEARVSQGLDVETFSEFRNPVLD